MASRIDFVEREWSRELARKGSLEQRAITVITASGVLVTLMFGFAAAVAKGQNFANFSNSEKVLLAIALFFFIASSISGIMANTPRNYGAIPLDQLRPQPGSPDKPIDDETLEGLMIQALKSARVADDDKARALTWAIGLQVVAIFVLGLTVVLVVR